MKFMYLRDDKDQLIGCLAMATNRSDIGSVTYYQLSVSHPNDLFSKSMARKIAEGRLNKTPLYVCGERYSSTHEITKAVMKNIIDIGNLSEAKNTYKNKMPNRAVKAAKIWLAKFAG